MIGPYDNPIAAYGRSGEVSNGKDTTTGHWEMAGLYLEEPFQTFPKDSLIILLRNLKKKNR